MSSKEQEEYKAYLRSLLERPYQGGNYCKHPGCKDKSKSKGYCNRHYAQVIKYGKVTRD